MKHVRGNPDWNNAEAIRVPIASATSFDEVVEVLGLQPEDLAASTALKEWAKRNKDRRYVPSDLLRQWDLTSIQMRRQGWFRAGSIREGRWPRL